MAQPQNAEEPEVERIQRELIETFAQKLSVRVPSETTDLFESGILDSQGVVELLAYIEDRFNALIPVEDLELDNLRSVQRIASLIMQHKPSTVERAQTHAARGAGCESNR